MAAQLFENSRLVACPHCGAKHLERRMCECLRRNAVPSAEERSGWYWGHRTSTAAQVSRRPLSSRLIDVAALCFLRGLAMVGRVKRRLP